MEQDTRDTHGLQSQGPALAASRTHFGISVSQSALHVAPDLSHSHSTMSDRTATRALDEYSTDTQAPM
jgi:hypothetical protein